MTAIAPLVRSCRRSLAPKGPSTHATTLLAPQAVDRVFDTARTINKGGVTIPPVEQNAMKALENAETAYMLHGEVVLAASGAELLHDDAARQAYLR